MENFDIPIWFGFVFLLPVLIGLLPSVAIAGAGIWALKRGHQVEGILLLISGVLGFLNHSIPTVLSRIVGWSWYEGYMGYALRGSGILSGVTLAVGVWLLVKALPAK